LATIFIKTIWFLFIMSAEIRYDPTIVALVLDGLSSPLGRQLASVYALDLHKLRGTGFRLEDKGILIGGFSTTGWLDKLAGDTVELFYKNMGAERFSGYDTWVRVPREGKPLLLNTFDPLSDDSTPEIPLELIVHLLDPRLASGPSGFRPVVRNGSEYGNITLDLTNAHSSHLPRLCSDTTPDPTVVARILDSAASTAYRTTNGNREVFYRRLLEHMRTTGVIRK
jgi:hypothetical protein